MDDYDFGDGSGGNWGFNYGEADPYYDTQDNGSWGMDYNSNAFNPDEYLASQGGYTPPHEPGLWDALKDIPSNAGKAFLGHLQSNPIGVLSLLGGFGGDLYSTIQGNKQREAMARQMQDARNKREATLARYGAVLPMKMERTMLPQGDLLHAGERSGGTQWFTPTQFRNMADGGAVKPSWFDSLLSRKPVPAVVGSGTAATAGDALQNRNYQLYKQMQEMDDNKPLPYDVWVQLQQQGKGYAAGGALSRMVRGSGGGQDDQVPINASPGEYIFDADTVSSIGDGSNDEGARRLDEMRKRLRAHKRSASHDKIPPKAKNPEAYLKGK